MLKRKVNFNWLLRIRVHKFTKYQINLIRDSIKKIRNFNEMGVAEDNNILIQVDFEVFGHVQGS